MKAMAVENGFWPSAQVTTEDPLPLSDKSRVYRLLFRLESERLSQNPIGQVRFPNERHGCGNFTQGGGEAACFMEILIQNHCH